MELSKANCQKKYYKKTKIEKLKNKKQISQPFRVKTSGSTFKNPLDQTKKSMGINKRIN